MHSVHRNRSVPPGFGTELILKDTLVHDVDVVRFLLGEEVVRATVHAGRPSALAPDGVQDPVVVVLRTETGVVVTVEAFVNAQYAYDIRCEVVGETGTLALPAPPEPAVGFEDRFAAAYTAELRAWVAAVAVRRPGRRERVGRLRGRRRVRGGPRVAALRRAGRRRPRAGAGPVRRRFRAAAMSSGGTAGLRAQIHSTSRRTT